jgi:hypothetical protein
MICAAVDPTRSTGVDLPPGSTAGNREVQPTTRQRGSLPSVAVTTCCAAAGFHACTMAISVRQQRALVGGSPDPETTRERTQRSAPYDVTAAATMVSVALG